MMVLGSKDGNMVSADLIWDLISSGVSDNGPLCGIYMSDPDSSIGSHDLFPHFTVLKKDIIIWQSVVIKVVDKTATLLEIG